MLLGLQRTAGNRATIQRMLACPPRLAPGERTPSGWQAYHGDTSWFHCGFRGILEDRLPVEGDPQNECFYDHSGTLVDASHPYAGCRGTPNDYDSARDPGRHATIDRGGIVRAGGPAFLESRVYSVVTPMVNAIAAAIRVVDTVGQVGRGLVESVGTGVLAARASVDVGNWVFEGLPARSVRHLNVMGAFIGSETLNGSLDSLLRSLTRRLDGFPIDGLLTELAQDVNQALAARGAAAPRVTPADLGLLSFVQLAEWLRDRGLIRYRRPPQEIAEEQWRAMPPAPAGPAR
jgi:hypothetical protein